MRSRLPPPWLIFSLALGVVLGCLALYKGIQDSDFFWHLTTGRLIAESGVPRTDPFSFTWNGKPWNPYSWLSELLMYRLVSGIGEAGALVVFASAPAAILVVLGSALARRGVAAIALVPPLALAGWMLLPYVTLRPQVLSWLLMAVVMTLLLSIDHRRRWPLFLLPPLIAVWANLHGLWVMGVAVIGLYTVLSLFGRGPMSSARRPMVVTAVACILAAGLTPAGLPGILYPLTYLNPGIWALEHIAEWQSPDFHDPTHWGLLVIFATLALNRGRATPAWLTVLPLIGVALSLSSIRNVPLLAIWAVPTLAFGLNDRVQSHLARRPGPRQDLGRRLLELGAAALVMIVAIVVLFPRDLTGRMEGSFEGQYPVKGVDILLNVDPEANLLAEYNWGGYAISRLHDAGGRVFVDGRDGEMYSAQVLNDYSTLVGARRGWEDLVDRYGVGAILLRPSTPLVRGLAQEEGWCEVFRDDEQVLLLRDCSAG